MIPKEIETFFYELFYIETHIDNIIDNSQEEYQEFEADKAEMSKIVEIAYSSCKTLECLNENCFNISKFLTRNLRNLNNRAGELNTRLEKTTSLIDSQTSYINSIKSTLASAHPEAELSFEIEEEMVLIKCYYDDYYYFDGTYIHIDSDVITELETNNPLYALASSFHEKYNITPLS